MPINTRAEFVKAMNNMIDTTNPVSDELRLYINNAGINELNFIDFYGYTPLDTAIYTKSIDLVKLLVEKDANVNSISGNNYRPLHTATESGTFEIVKLLIENGADVNVFTKNNNTPLILAARSNDTEMVTLLLENGASREINTRSKNLDHPLVYAVQNNNINMARILLENNADANVRSTDNNKYTPLMIASKSENSDIVQLLINKGVDANEKNLLGQTALDLTENIEITSLLKSKTIRIDTPFKQGFLVINSAEMLPERGVCFGICLESVRWYMKHIAKGENEEELNVVLDKFNTMNYKEDDLNFLKRIALYHSEQVDLDKKTSEFKKGFIINPKNNFVESLPDEIKDKKFIGFAFMVFDRNGNAKGAHIINIRKIGNEERYEVLDPNFGITKCNNNEELNTHIGSILYFYQKNNIRNSQRALLYDFEGVVKARNWNYELLLDSETPEEQEIKRNRNKSKKYELPFALLKAIKQYSSNNNFIERLINENNVNEPDLNGKTPLEYAIDSDSPEIVETLLNAGAKTTIRSSNSCDEDEEKHFLHYAINKDKFNVVKFFYEKGNITLSENSTIMQMNEKKLLEGALHCRAERVTKFLVEKDVDLSEDDFNKLIRESKDENRISEINNMKEMLSRIKVEKVAISNTVNIPISGGVSNVSSEPRKSTSNLKRSNNVPSDPNKRSRIR